LTAARDINGAVDSDTLSRLEPRTQTVGSNEVYNDPRQRRLLQYEARKQAKNPMVDGANLGFRDKMKLFAAKLGEQHSPPQKQSFSSVERELER